MADEVLSQEEIEALVADGAAGKTDQDGSSPDAGLVQATSGSVVQVMDFGSVHGSASGGAVSGVDLIFDVQLQVTVELGRATMTVKEVLALGAGSVVELNKHAGEPVEVVVNNKIVARGEVVVIDENFGVRITEIVSASERIHRAKAA